MKKAILFCITLWAEILGEENTKFFIERVLEVEGDEEVLKNLYDDIFDVYVVLACSKFEEHHGELSTSQRELWMISEEETWTKKFRDLLPY